VEGREERKWEEERERGREGEGFCSLPSAEA